MKVKETYKKSESLKELETLFNESKRKEHPNLPDHARVWTKFTDDNSNALTTSIMAYLKVKNAFGARINVQGQWNEKLKRYTKSGSTTGMPDVSAIVKGRFIGIEVKYGKDVQSDRQRVVQKQIEEAGGLYFIARDFESFYTWFNNEFKN
jgi:hypothetical protein